MGKVETKCEILEVLSKAAEPMRPSDIGEIVGLIPIVTGRYLADMAKSGLAQKPDKKKSFYEITEKGRQYLANPPEELETEELEGTTQEKHIKEAHKGSTEDTTEDITEDTTGETRPETVPSQSDLFKGIGERLGVGIKKGDVRLDAIIYYVQRTANLDDLNSVWNALTEMGVASDVKKRWIKLYSQNLPDKQIPDELKEKMESGQETEKVSVEGKGEIPPKPKRFSVVGDQIIGDPEGDYNFKEALQLLAQNKGVPAEQANPLVAAMEAMKIGPDIATSMMAALTPLIIKEPPKPDNTVATLLQQQAQSQQQQLQLMQQRMEQLADEKHKAEMESLRAEFRTGQKPPESNQQIQQLTQQIESLRTQLQQQQIETLTQQSRTQSEQLQAQITKLEHQITAATQGKQVESKIGLMSEGLQGVLGELKGVRADARPVVETLIKGRPTIPPPRTAKEKAAFSSGLDKGIAKAKEAKRLADKLWFSGVEPQG